MARKGKGKRKASAPAPSPRAKRGRNSAARDGEAYEDWVVFDLLAAARTRNLVPAGGKVRLRKQDLIDLLENDDVAQALPLDNPPPGPSAGAGNAANAGDTAGPSGSAPTQDGQNNAAAPSGIENPTVTEPRRVETAEMIQAQAAAHNNKPPPTLLEIMATTTLQSEILQHLDHRDVRSLRWALPALRDPMVMPANPPEVGWLINCQETLSSRRGEISRMLRSLKVYPNLYPPLTLDRSYCRHHHKFLPRSSRTMAYHGQGLQDGTLQLCNGASVGAQSAHGLLYVCRPCHTDGLKRFREFEPGRDIAMCMDCIRAFGPRTNVSLCDCRERFLKDGAYMCFDCRYSNHARWVLTKESLYYRLRSLETTPEGQPVPAQLRYSKDPHTLPVEEEVPRACPCGRVVDDEAMGLNRFIGLCPCCFKPRSRWHPLWTLHPSQEVKDQQLRMLATFHRRYQKFVDLITSEARGHGFPTPHYGGGPHLNSERKILTYQP